MRTIRIEDDDPGSLSKNSGESRTMGFRNSPKDHRSMDGLPQFCPIPVVSQQRKGNAESYASSNP